MGERREEKKRAELQGAEAAVSDVLDEVNYRGHGLMSSSSYYHWFLDWLEERGYQVTPIVLPCGHTAEESQFSIRHELCAGSSRGESE